jgi:exo-beta-1,3-glucanase (GH17 family)
MQWLSALLFSAFTVSVSARNLGIDYDFRNADGNCKSQADWEAHFRTAASRGMRFARLYSTNDCGNQLMKAVPAALNTGTMINVGIWLNGNDDQHFGYEKGALLDVLAAYPDSTKWMYAITVGSEDLYRGGISPHDIAMKVYDVRGMVRAKGVVAPVGHADNGSW